jgi:hypothetical protein
MPRSMQRRMTKLALLVCSGGMMLSVTAGATFAADSSFNLGGSGGGATTLPATPVVPPPATFDLAKPAPAPAAPAAPTLWQAATTTPAPASAPSSALRTSPASAPAAPATAAPADLAAAGAANPPAAAPAEENEVKNQALAERLTTMAGGLVRSQNLTPAVWRYANGLLEAAVRLAPDDPRYASLWVESTTHLGDPDATIKAIAAYRKARDARALPDDEAVQVQLIDLYLGKMDRDAVTAGSNPAEKKLTYLNTIINAERQLGPAVRSVAACRAATLLAERLENQAAWKMVDVAFALNPLNLEALRMKFEQLRYGRLADRVRAQMGMLIANPQQPVVAAGIARDVAAAGLVAKSLEWYNWLLELHRRLGIRPANDIGIDYAAELFISGDNKAATAVATDITNNSPDDLNGWLLRLVLAKQAGDKLALEAVIRQATNALNNRISGIRQEAGDKAATTQPADAPQAAALPDPLQVVKTVAASGRQDLMGQLIPAVGGVAWMKIYFQEKPAEALPWINALQGVASGADGEELLGRLRGWAFLTAGNKDDAKKALAPVADRDAVAQLGMIKLAAQSPDGKKAAIDLAKKLLAQNCSSLAGAIIFEAVAPLGVHVEANAAAKDVDDVLKSFPQNWLKIVNNPEQFYSIRMEPVRVGVPVGDPMLVRVIVTASGTLPLTLGPEGVIHPDLWIDVQMRGAAAQAGVFPAEAYARLAGPLVLLPKSSQDHAETIVRIDRSQLARALESQPTGAFQVSARVMTNPLTIGGQVTNGPVGTQAQLTKLMERTGAPVSVPTLTKLSTTLENGTAEEKVRCVETLSKFAVMLSDPGANDMAKQMGGQASDAVRRTTTDTDPAVRAWAKYVYCVNTHDKQVLASLIADRESWVSRTLGIILSDYLGEDHSNYADLARTDDDAMVKRIASAALEANIVRPATSQPTSQPAASQPTTPITEAPAAAPAAAAPVPATPGAVPAAEAQKPAAAASVPGTGTVAPSPAPALTIPSPEAAPSSNAPLTPPPAPTTPAPLTIATQPSAK